MDMSSRPPLTPGGGTAGATSGATDADSGATGGVTALYQAHAVGLIRLAIVMLGDRGAAEDVVQDAFLGLYRHWDRLADTGNALTYVRSAVLNRCRNALRQRGQRDRHDRQGPGPTASESAEAVALVGEENQQVLAGIRALPDRQREALVLRFYLDLSEEETARAMGVSRGTVKSATSRAVAALGRKLKEGS
jgi:RNA polymerase sigma-70 factor (sigma-E family)